MRDLDGEGVVYDFQRHKAHCLNPTAFAVFRLADGTRTPRQIAAALAGSSERTVWNALDQLDAAHLLETPIPQRVDRDRRRVLKKLAISIAAPAVWSILAPTPAYAASSSPACFPAGNCTGPGTPSGCCNNGGRAFACTGAGANMCMGTSAQCTGQVCR